MKTIKVFVASSEEMREERLELADFFCHLNRVFKPRGIVFELSKWEYLDESMGPARKQQEYNDEIKTCDMCLVLYWTRLGSYTGEELQTAYTELKAGRKPYKLYVYFKELGECSPEIQAFKSTFEEHYGHFYCKYANIDTLKFRFLLQLENYHNSGAMTVEDAHVKIDGQSVATLTNVPFAANNEHYQDLKQRIAKLNEEITTFATLLQATPNDVIEKMLNDKRCERHQLSEELAKYEQNLFDIAMRMSRYSGERVSARMQRALELFEAGKVSEANVVLEDAEREADASLAEFRQAKQLLAAKKENIVHSIDELLLKASVTIADTAIQPEERIEQANSLYKKAIELSRECEIDKKKYSKILGDYYSFLKEYAKYSDAMSIVQENLELDREIFGESHPDVATCYNNIGAIYDSQGDYATALDYYEKSLAIRLAIVGESHSDVALCYNNIGGIYDSQALRVAAVYYNQGDYAKALDYYEQSLSINFSVFGDSHPDVASSYNNIALVYSSQGDYAKALAYYEKSLAINLSIFGESHPDVASVYNGIGGIYDSQGDYAKALAYYEKSLAIRLAIVGESHPDVAKSYNSVGHFYKSTGDYLKALEYYKKSLAIKLEIFGESSPENAGLYNGMGSIYKSLGNYSMALECCNKSLEIRLAAFGESHVGVAFCYNNMGEIYSSQGDYAKALEYFEKTLAIRLSIFDESHPQTVECIEKIAFAHLALGDNEKALEYMKRGAAAGSEKCSEYLRENGIE